MKKTLCSFLIASFFQICFAQDIRTAYKAVQVVTPQSYYLNGGTKAAFGGKSRTYFMITLPANTVEWYYAITTTPNQNENPTIGLASQIMKFLDPTRGLAATAISSIMAPSGAGVCDVYLYSDINSVSQFVNKTSQPSSIPSGLRENFRHGVVQIRDAIQGTYFLALRNPSAATGINIVVDVVAIVADREMPLKTEEQQKAEMYGSLGWKEYQNGNYDKCLELSKKALELDNTLGWVQSNIALVYLVTEKTEATDAYVQAIELIKKSPYKKRMFAGAIKDIDDAKAKLGDIKGADIIRGLLVDEYKRCSVVNR